MLHLYNITVLIDQKKVVSDFSFKAEDGKTYFLMGPNGSGKSSLLYALAGNPLYHVDGIIMLHNEDITTLAPEKRAQKGLFLSMQYPQEIPGVTLRTLLKESWRFLYPEHSFELLYERIKSALEVVAFDEAFLDRGVNEGLSGGERKRSEIFQMLVLQPSVVLLDEIDSGLDSDALKIVTQALVWFRQQVPHSIMILVTHYGFSYQNFPVDSVVVIKNGTLVTSGGRELVHSVQQHGYESVIGI